MTLPCLNDCIDFYENEVPDICLTCNRRTRDEAHHDNYERIEDHDEEKIE